MAWAQEVKQRRVGVAWAAGDEGVRWKLNCTELWARLERAAGLGELEAPVVRWAKRGGWALWFGARHVCAGLSAALEVAEMSLRWSGGEAAAARQQARQMVVRRAKLKAEAQRSMASYLKVESCSGRPLEPVGERITWTRTAAARAQGRQRAATRRKAERAARGQEAIRGDEWAVESAMGVRRREGSQAFEVLIAWAGDWPDDWRPFGKLNTRMREEARVLVRRFEEEERTDKMIRGEVRRWAAAAARAAAGLGARKRTARPTDAEGDGSTRQLRPRATMTAAREGGAAEESDEESDGGSEGREMAGGEEMGVMEEGFDEVDEVREVRGKGRQAEVLVRWAGYESGEDTWVPRSSLNAACEVEVRRRLAETGAARRSGVGPRASVRRSGQGAAKRRERAEMTAAERRAAETTAARQRAARATRYERRRAAAEGDGRAAGAQKSKRRAHGEADGARPRRATRASRANGET